MALIIPYEQVLHELSGKGFKSLYHNSGSFGFAPGVMTRTVGWIGPPDATIRAEARDFTRQIDPPFAPRLAEMATGTWEKSLGGVVWAMPRSHWAYELDFGSPSWLPAALAQVGVDSGSLATLANGAALEFQRGQGEEFASFLTVLLDNLSGSSDFQLVWPKQPILCTVHHHQQLWWTTSDELLYRVLDAMTHRR